MEQELEKSLDQRDEALKANITKSVEEKIEEVKKSIPQPVDNAEELKSLNDKTDAIQKSLEEMAEANKGLANQVSELKEKSAPVVKEKKTLVSTIKTAIIEQIDRIKGMNSTADSIKLELKGASTTGSIDTDEISGNPVVSQFEPGVVRIQNRRPYLREIINVSPTTAGNIQWVEQDFTDPADVTAEGTSKTEVEQGWVVKEAKVQKITAYTKVSEEMLEDVEWASQEIANTLVEQVLLKEDSQIYDGNGTAPQYAGLKYYASSFGVTSSLNSEFYHNVAGATRVDVLRVAAALIAKANFTPTHVVLNPADAALIDLAKSTTGSYVNKSVNDMLRNVTIIENNGVAAGDFLIGDFTKSNYRIRKDVGLVIGRDSDDLTKNLWTMVVELRGAHYVASNHVAAFVKGTFSTCISAINGGATAQNVNIAGPLNSAGTAVATDEI